MSPLTRREQDIIRDAASLIAEHEMVRSDARVEGIPGWLDRNPAADLLLVALAARGMQRIQAAVAGPYTTVGNGRHGYSYLRAPCFIGDAYGHLAAVSCRPYILDSFTCTVRAPNSGEIVHTHHTHDVHTNLIDALALRSGWIRTDEVTPEK